MKDSVGSQHWIAVGVASCVHKFSQPGEVVRITVCNDERSTIERLGSQHVRVSNVYVAAHVFLFAAIDEQDLPFRGFDNRSIALSDVNESHLEHRTVSEDRLFRQQPCILNCLVLPSSFAPLALLKLRHMLVILLAGDFYSIPPEQNDGLELVARGLA